MKIVIRCLLLFCLLVAAPASGAEPMRSFYLEGVRSGRVEGPFLFRTGSLLALDTGTFRLEVVSEEDGTFLLADADEGNVFGAYELVPGRIIDVGYSLFTITRIHLRSLPAPAPAAPKPRPATPPARNRQRPTPRTAPLAPLATRSAFTAGILFDVLNRTSYEWTLNGVDGGSARYLERRGASAYLTRDFLTLQIGLLTDSDWDEEVDDPLGLDFEGATLARGTGWSAAAKVAVPAWQEGRWSVSLEGKLQYRHETFSLEYGSWETSTPPSSGSSTNDLSGGGTNSIPIIQQPAPEWVFVQRDEEATLTEALLALSLRIHYRAPAWFWYAGLRAFPWSDTDLDAEIQAGSRRFTFDFSRRDPVSGFGGIGVRYADIHGYLELEGGGVNALRIGLYMPF